jgi:hypothetical protein
MKRKYLDSMTIVVPRRENADGTETLKTGHKRVRSCVEVERKRGSK